MGSSSTAAVFLAGIAIVVSSNAIQGQVRQVGDLRAGLSPDGSGAHIIVSTALAASPTNPVAMFWTCRNDGLGIVLLIPREGMEGIRGVGVQHGVLAPDTRVDRWQHIEVKAGGPTQLVIENARSFTMDAVKHDALSIGVRYDSGWLIHEFRIRGLSQAVSEGPCGVQLER